MYLYEACIEILEVDQPLRKLLDSRIESIKTEQIYISWDESNEEIYWWINQFKQYWDDLCEYPVKINRNVNSPSYKIKKTNLYKHVIAPGMSTDFTARETCYRCHCTADLLAFSMLYPELGFWNFRFELDNLLDLKPTSIFYCSMHGKVRICVTALTDYVFQHPVLFNWMCLLFIKI